MKRTNCLDVLIGYALVVAVKSTSVFYPPNVYNDCGMPECNEVPAAPRKEDEAHIELFDLLSRGSNFLVNYTDVNEAVVLLGNTGSGKSTLAQILSDNLGKLESVITENCNFVIIDEDNMIGLPSTKSKTLFPELVYLPGTLPNSTGLPMYDYPGFDDTRGDVEDIAANFFMNQVTGKITNLKMLFLVIHSSVNFQDRTDFDLLATNAVSFVKDINKYMESFALIVTKVPNVNPGNGGAFPDRLVVSGIVNFLERYKNDLSDKLDTEKAEDEMITKKKILFVKRILEIDPITENYTKLWFVRLPNQCGPLSEQQIFIDTRTSISGVINKLDFTRVNAEVDFGFTLKAETKLNLANYTRSINSVITSAIQNMTGVLETNFFAFENLVDISNLNLTDINTTMHTNALVVDIISGLNETTVTNSIGLSNVMKLLWSRLGYNLPNKFISTLRWQEKYLIFFDKAAGVQQDRDVSNWVLPLRNFATLYLNYLDWYEFCLAIDFTVTSYDFQASKHELSEKPISQQWLDYIDDNVLPVSRPIKDISQRITTKNVDLLNISMVFALDKVQTICDETLKVVTVFGQFLELKRHLNTTLLLQGCNNVVQIRLYAGHTIFLDTDILVEDLDIVIIAPVWESTTASDLSLTLGAKATVSQTGADPGIDCYADGQGSNGTAGCSGKPGSPGGNMFGISDRIAFKHAQYTFFVKSEGANGEKGQDGGEGGNSCKFRDAKFKGHSKYKLFCEGYHLTLDDVGDKPQSCEAWTRVCAIFPTTIMRYKHYGFDGLQGGNGGDGGKGGSGGYPGILEFIQLDEIDPPQLNRVTGSDGMSGLGGIGGNGGATGRGYRCEPKCWSDHECKPIASENKVPGSNGFNGRDGASSSCLKEPDLPRPMSPPWIPIVKYKTLFFNNTNPTTTWFLRKFDENQTIKRYFTLKALAEEAFALTSISKMDSQPVRLREMYTSLINRLEEFSKLNYDGLTSEHKKVLSMLLTSAISTLMSLDKYQNFDVIVDISYYFLIVRMQMDSFIKSQALVVIQEAKNQFQQNLKDKVDQALGFLEDIVTPAIHQAAAEIELQLEILEKQLVDLIVDIKISMEESKAKLRKANEEQEFFKFLKVFNVITSIGTAFMPTPEFKTFDILVKQLQGQFSGSPNELERLKQLVEESERLVADLEDKRQSFENQFLPMVDSLMSYFRNVSESLATGSQVSAPKLGLTKWQVLGKLKETKNALDTFADSSLNVIPLRYAFDQIHDAMTMAIDLYEMIDQYMETQNLAGYMATVASATLEPIPITDPELAHTIANFDLKLRENLLDVEVNKAMHAFKQWVFPFAKLYFNRRIIHDRNIPNTASLGVEHLRKLEILHTELEKYKATSVGDQDTFIIKQNFSSGLKTSKPFFIWENEQWTQSINDLVVGSDVIFNADVRQQGVSNWDAIKFKLIEINFKLDLNKSTEGEKLQEEFDDIIEYFGVSMTHSGVSYYRFQQDYFVMTGANQTLIYNFEQDSNGNRYGTNLVYEKFKNGDCLLSPYSVWTIRLINVIPIQKGRNLRKDVGFESLKKFVPYMDLELVGTGTYVNGQAAVDAAGGDLQLNMYYAKDERIII